VSPKTKAQDQSRRRAGEIEASKISRDVITSNDDRRFAEMAVAEAFKSVPEDSRPHPKVGAVVVKDGKVLAVAHRGEVEACHAEYIALEKKLKNEIVAGATVYTTLEPCTQRNDPKIACAYRLKGRRVARVVMGILDPNPTVFGQGYQVLRDAGIQVQFFPADLVDKIDDLNRDFVRDQKKKAQIASSGVKPLKWKPNIAQ
jgi:pyrimidine deaminase RibD-like protein